MKVSRYRVLKTNNIGSKKMNRFIITLIIGLAIASSLNADQEKNRTFNPEKDLVSLHYDHAPDKDDGQSAAADRTILETFYGTYWIKRHVVAVSGAYGKNARRFNSKSDTVMDAAWKEPCGWLAANVKRKEAIDKLVQRWSKAIQKGGDVWVKEGGQSDITADVLKEIRNKFPDLDTKKHIHVIQHGRWNENQTTDAALYYTKKYTHYVKIQDANRYLNIQGGDKAFEKVAMNHQLFGTMWKAAFDYYPPKQRLDFSDTGELMHILGLGEMSIQDFRKRFLDEK
jgi:hypothetical protein